MNVTYALQPIQKSIFLAGPTPRSPDVKSWRPYAISLLRFTFNFDGTVFVPESKTGKPHDEYDNQITWEWEAINQSTVVVFWIPRELDTMPGFTTNIEFGSLASSGKVVAGAPQNAKKMGYIHAMSQRYNIPVFRSLEAVLREAVDRVNKPFGKY